MFNKRMPMCGRVLTAETTPTQ